MSWEEKKVLSETRPESVGQARRIEGVTPSGALCLLAYVKGAWRRDQKSKVFKETVEAHAPGKEVETLA